MLHLETVKPGTFAILKKLMSLPEMADFYLVGGTALALQYGHRSSEDPDLFCISKFDHETIKEILLNEFGSQFSYEGNFSKIGIFCFLNDVKVDIVYYPHPLIGNPINRTYPDV